ncbi:hypothetical protein BN1723_008615 [Verticillium longisporum]|uniref:PHD-type domain-containing protein n=1 Tax=Verticillium longisporum TaxID=100787 RepID=A0A0G4KH82_VERLO|nr:hypothetical protein BN1723_008615 [Verticillium longisporum]
MDHAGDQPVGKSPSSVPTTRQQEDHDMPDAQPAPAASSPHERSVPPSSNTVLPSTEKPPPAPTKKRGQAAVKKPTKRSKGNAGPRAGKKQTAPKASSGDRDDHDDSAAQLEERGAASPSPDDDDSIDPGPYCLCRGPDDHRFMIFCDICQDWFHGECVDMDRDVGNNLVERFVCPNCTDLASNVRTLYKKTCSLKNCTQEARLYGDRETKEEVKLEDKSVFCSDEHRQLWWEKYVAAMPKKDGSGAKTLYGDITQAQIMALLGDAVSKADKTNNWKLAARPFAPEDGDNGSDPKKVLPPGTLTEEEELKLKQYAAERYQMGEDTVAYSRMLELMDMAGRRRAALVAAKKMDDSVCGYDYRLDTIGVRQPFAAFMATKEAQEIFKQGSLEHGSVMSGADRNFCDKKRCKPHHGWYQIHTKDVRYLMRCLTSEANKKLNLEAEIRDAAVQRRLRKEREGNGVEYHGQYAVQLGDQNKSVAADGPLETAST